LESKVLIVSDTSAVPEKPGGRKPFQFTLRSLFAITTFSALFLGLLRACDRPGFSVLFSLVMFVPFFCLGRWCSRPERMTRPGFALSLLILFAGIALIGATMLFVAWMVVRTAKATSGTWP
jgi:uncharacterized membrane protein